MSSIISTQCAYCRKPLKRTKYSLARHPLSFCNQECFVYYNEPKQAHLMEHIRNNNFYYLIGLILTDGCVIYPENNVKGSYTACIKLHKRDEQLIQSIYDMFGGYLSYENYSVCWRTGNKHFVNFLKSIGIVRRKTHCLDVTLLKPWFDVLTDTQQQFFIRGCIDGDGGCYLNICPSIMLCNASYEFIDMIHKHLNIGKINIHTKEHQLQYKSSIHATVPLHYLNIHGIDTQKIVQMYLNINTCNDLYMKRKYDTCVLISHHKYRKTTSIYRGVQFNPLCKYNPWSTAFIHNATKYHIGRYPTEQQAAIAYDNYIKTNNIPNKVLNFS